jgi:tRNA (mo5U34)-methyltransferase
LDKSYEKLQTLGFPESFAGKSVLDVGAWDGFFSFEAEARQADRVVASDYYCWSSPAGEDDPVFFNGNGFEIAHWARQSRIERRMIAVEDISPDTVGTFDYVFFLGVLYHAQDPLRYLRNVYSVCADTLILETHVDGLEYDRPMMVFYPGTTLNGVQSNYWGPNRQCVEDMLREVGFTEVTFVSHDKNASRMAFHARR